MTTKLSRAHWLIFIVNKRTYTQIYNLCISKSETSICHFLTNRESALFLLADKRAKQVMNLVGSD